jgi:hypothetical protein
VVGSGVELSILNSQFLSEEKYQSIQVVPAGNSVHSPKQTHIMLFTNSAIITMTSSNRGNNNGRSEPISVDDICIGGSGIKGNEGTSLFYNHIDSSNFFDENYLASIYSDYIEPFLQKGCKFFLYNQETNRYDFIPLQSEDDQNKLANVIRDIVLSKYNEFWDFVYKAAGSLDVGTNPSEQPMMKHKLPIKIFHGKTKRRQKNAMR